MPVSCLRAIALVLCLAFAANAWALDSFTIGDIDVQGLQRLDQGTVLTYLPLSVGDRLTANSANRAIRSLYDTGLFDNVALARDGDTLIVKIKERPEIAGFDIEGNKQIGGDDLKKSLKKQGLAKGELYKRALLDQLQLELRRQYYANGFYGVKIDTKVKQLENNRVKIHIQVDEGDVATIKQINIVGNHDFSDARLRDVFQLQESKSMILHPIAAFRKKDRYSKEKLLGDLESLNSFYQDRGYLRFKVTSIQVSVSPDKRNIFLTVNVNEGQPYTISDYHFAGDLIVPETSLQRLVSVRKGQTFSRKQVTDTTNRISSGLADFGYAFAKVDPLTRLDNKKHTVEVTFFVDPGKRAYVRHITFSGNQKTNDRTLRREMRQFEGSTFSRRAVERSRTRLARLPFIEDATVNTQPVPGSKDLVDVDFDVKERPAGTLQFGVGFSDAQGFLVNGSITHSNFRGTGNRLRLSAETNDYTRSVSASWTDPYATPDGISRTVAAFFRKSDQVIRFGSGFDLNSIGASVTYGIPISEFSTVRIGGGVQENKINTRIIPGLVSRQLERFVNDNGKDFLTYELRTGIQRDTRNRTFFATRGTNTQLDWNVKLPGSDLEYYTLSFRHERFFRVGSWTDWLSNKFVVQSKLRVADAVVYGKGNDVPPYDNFFAGGARSVRGFENGYLGPRDSFNNPYGGQFLTTLQNELVIPTPLASDNKSTRLSLFYDVGNVYSGADKFEASELRKSAGVAFYWFTPFFGLLRLSYAAYVDDQPGDKVDRFQFSFGVGL